jgi:protocatechuate 3,4-dioxygenase beta subunit
MTQDEKNMNRRAALGILGAAGAAFALGCGSGDSSATGAGGGGGGSSSSSGSSTCTDIPDETAGPYPDKTGMISNPATFRQDITEGKAGLPLTVTLTVVNVNDGCSAVQSANVEIWQCDADGHYSEYAQPGYDGTGQTFLRGIQTTDKSGQVTFTTIYPGWYMGRATHIHVEVYVNGKSVKITQMAFPEAITAQVYAVAPYAAHGQNTTKNAGDMAFSDGDDLELCAVTGDTASGFSATLTLGISM